jgi:TQXA domain-containing protein
MSLFASIVLIVGLLPTIALADQSEAAGGGEESSSVTTLATSSGAYVGWRGDAVNTSRGSSVVSLYVAPFQDYVDNAGNDENLINASEVAYCYNQNRQWPLNLSNGTWDNSANGYIRYNKTANVSGTAFLASTTPSGWTYDGMGTTAQGPLYSDGDLLKKHVLSIALNGYPKDYSGFQKKYGIDDSAFRALTQRAIWNATDGYNYGWKASDGLDSAGTTPFSNWSAAEQMVFKLLVTSVLPDSVLTAADTGQAGSALDLYTWDGNGWDQKEGTDSSDHNVQIGKGYQNLLAVSTASVSETIGPRSLTITKKVDGTDAQKADSYSFSVKVSFDGAKSGDSNYWYVASDGATVSETSTGSGVYTVTLTNNGKVEFFAANPKFSYTVEEATPSNGLTPEVTVTGGGSVDATNSGKVSGTDVTKDVTLAYTNYDTSTFKDVKISKRDVAGSELPGASMQLLDSAGKVLDEWTSTTTPHESVVSKGTETADASYTLKEIAAPEGYKVASSISFTVDKDGKVTVGNTVLESDAPIVMTDAAQDLYKVKVSKQDVLGNELSGAHLQIINSKTNATKAEWDSDGSTKEVELYPGSYVLKETAAPDGYDLATNISFTISDEGKVTVGDTELKTNAPIVMVDKLGTVDVKLSKQDVGGAELPGASMELRDAQGKVLESWTSGTAPHEVTVNKGTAAGKATYILHEEVAPEGYKVATDITFEVDSQGVITRTDAEIVTNASIVMVDSAAEKQAVNVSKQDVLGNELVGAQLKIVNSTTGEEKESWESDGTVHKVELFPGKYQLVETAAPDGYELATTIDFTVGEDGTITRGTTILESDAPIVMIDEVSSGTTTYQEPGNENPVDEEEFVDSNEPSSGKAVKSSDSKTKKSNNTKVTKLAKTGDPVMVLGGVGLAVVLSLVVMVIAGVKMRKQRL